VRCAAATQARGQRIRGLVGQLVEVEPLA
jgi:hypothetical protein